MAVAARYRGDERSVTFGRRLIGPELFPTYLKVLAVNFIITLVIAAIVFVAGGTIWSGFAGILVPLAIQFAVVTASSWASTTLGPGPGRLGSADGLVDGLRRRRVDLDGLAVQLIGKAIPRPVSVTTSILEFGLIAVALTVALQIGIPERIGPHGARAGVAGRVRAGPSRSCWRLSLTPLVNLVRPRWTQFRVAMHAAIDLATIADRSRLAGPRQLARPHRSDRPRPPTNAVVLVDAINVIVRISIAGTVVLTAVTAALELRRLVRMLRSPLRRHSRQVSAARTQLAGHGLARVIGSSAGRSLCRPGRPASRSRQSDLALFEPNTARLIDPPRRPA